MKYGSVTNNKQTIHQEIVIVKTLVLNILELSEFNIYGKQHYLSHYSANNIIFLIIQQTTLSSTLFSFR